MRDFQVGSIGHTGVTVSDIDASIAFYRDVLGFPVSQKVHVGGPIFATLTGVPDAEIDVAFVHAPGHEIELLCYLNPARVPSRLRPCDPGFLHICLKVSDIDAVVRSVSDHGFEAVSPIQTVPDGPAAGLRAIYVRDPDGVVLELIQEPPGVVLEQLFG